MSVIQRLVAGIESATSMGTLKPPSLQHLSKIWHPDSDIIARRLVAMIDSAPSFSYKPAHDAIRDMLVSRVSHEIVSVGLNRTPRRMLRQDFVCIAKLLHNHFRKVHIDHAIDFSAKYLNLGQGLQVPFNPPIVYRSEGDLIIPWFSLWRSFSLAGDKLSLFVTLADECIRSDPTLVGAKLRIFDFSATGSNKSRELKILESSSVPMLVGSKRDSMLSVFCAGYAQARNILSGRVGIAPRNVTYESQYPLILGWDGTSQSRS